jgi:hypothetical protein
MTAAVDGMASPQTARDPQNRFLDFQYHIEEVVEEGHTNFQIVAALTTLGFKTSTRSL